MSSAKPTYLNQPAHGDGLGYSASPEGEALTTVLLRTYPAPQRKSDRTDSPRLNNGLALTRGSAHNRIA